MDSATIDLQHRFYDMLMQSQYWSPERMRDYQRGQLTHLLRHAKKNVPFYENRLDAVMKPNGDIDWDKWSEIPIVKRSDLVEHREAMQAKELPPGHGEIGTVSSSGSTGLPITVSFNSLGLLANHVATWRAHHWHKIDWFQDTFGWRGSNTSVANGPRPRDRGLWGPPWLSPERLGHSYDLNYLVPIKTVVEHILADQPRYLTVTAKTAYMLALEFERLGQHPKVECVFTFGAKVEDVEREAMMRVMGARTLELYSSKEGQHMAHEQATGKLLNVNAELVLLEILNWDGRPAGWGEQGRIIVTPFYNTAQPLVRYETGDLGRWSRIVEQDTKLPTLAGVDGRIRHMFVHPDGRRISRELPGSMRKILGAIKWQTAQVGPTHFEVRYTTVEGAILGDENSFTQDFRKWYFEDATVTFRRMDDLPLNKEGKLIEYVSEWPDS